MLQRTRDTISCPICNRSWHISEGLKQGDDCPADDCPSNSEKPIGIVRGIMDKFCNNETYSMGTNSALLAMIPYWKAYLAENHNPDIITKELAEMIKQLTEMQAEIAARLLIKIGLPSDPPGSNAKDDVEGEIFPGASRAEIGHFMIQDAVGDYDAPDKVPEWKWVEEHASFNHVQNGIADGIWEFVLNLHRKLDPPLKLKPVISAARKAGLTYLIFHQGT